MAKAHNNNLSAGSMASVSIKMKEETEKGDENHLIVVR